MESDGDENQSLPSPIRIEGTVRRILKPPVRVCCVTKDVDRELEELLYRRMLEARVRQANGFVDRQ